MKVVLVRLPFYALFGLTNPKMKTYPLNLLYLATYAREVGGHNAVIVDGENIRITRDGSSNESAQSPEIVMNRGIPAMIGMMENSEHEIWVELEKMITGHNPELVGITCNSGNMDSARILVKRLKRLGLPVVLGGSHPTVLPEQSISYTGADMVSLGEGEITLVGIMDAIEGEKSFRNIPSLAWRNQSEIVLNPRESLIQDIDRLPIPDRSLVCTRDYFGDVIMTGRGCPFNCAYCASRNIWGKTVRLRSVSGIISELQILKARAEKEPEAPGRYVVKVVDDTFTVNRKRTLALLREIVDNGLDSLEFTGGVRADTLDIELVAMMKAANFRRVTLGVESGSPKILKMVRKGETNDDVRRAVGLLKEAGIKSHAFFMIGFPDETYEDVELSMRLIEEIKPDHVEINMVTPYPGTELFHRLVSEDPMKIDRWYRWFHQGMATHSDKLNFDLDRAYSDFLDFAGAFNESMDRENTIT
jgi:anaerobic magnesium-protoporphyrin IX monomethyl ester cyclase